MLHQLEPAALQAALATPEQQIQGQRPSCCLLRLLLHPCRACLLHVVLEVQLHVRVLTAAALLPGVAQVLHG
jgi:hypothetical protein